MTWEFTLTPTSSCGHGCGEQYQDISLHFANYVIIRRSVTPSMFDDVPVIGGHWIMEPPCWSAFRPICHVVYSRCTAECSSTTDLPHEICRPHHRRACCLHWLCVPQRIEYKIAVLTYKVLHGSAPRYLGPLARVADQPGRQTLRSASSMYSHHPSGSAVGSRSRVFLWPVHTGNYSRRNRRL